MMRPVFTDKALTVRTTLNLDPDVLDAARRLASAHAKSLGEIVSGLVRKGLEASPAVRRVKGFPVFDVPRNAKPFALDDIRREDDEW